ncbi:MAG: MoaD/ThiS family protein [Desulfohalobiaceae bacterium]|nr:MoaD/ThiS family protein [Desulfohalobiaceae bacterium]
MRIWVKCYATLREYQPQNNVLEVAEGERVETVLQDIGLPQEAAKVVFVNNKHGSLEQMLHEGDKIAVFPAVGGG